MKVSHGLALRAPLTVDLLQLGTDYMRKQLRQVGIDQINHGLAVVLLSFDSILWHWRQTRAGLALGTAAEDQGEGLPNVLPRCRPA